MAEKTMLDFNTIAARSLNASRNVHKPSYVGLRFLLAAVKENPDPFMRWVQSRCVHRKGWRYYSFPILKEASANTHPLYRNCLSNSPLTEVVETHVLSLMASQSAFQVPPSVYSYLWPSSVHSGGNFEYFMNGYTRRNQRISDLLSESPENVAVVTDIKAFYPSVDMERLQRKLRARLDRVSDPAAFTAIDRFCEAFFSVPKSTGIPIGPGLSHALGHVALESVDTAMSRAYGGRYFRYVDDIVIVCQRSEATSVTNTLRDAVNAEGLDLHEGKQDLVDGTAWLASPKPESLKAGCDEFRTLSDNIVLYLLRKPDESDTLRQMMLDQGFSLPMRKLSSFSKSSRYRYFLFGKFRAGDFIGWAKSLLLTKNVLVAQARNVRDQCVSIAEQLSGAVMPSQSTSRRFRVQRLRYVFNRLLYLFEPSQYQRLLQMSPKIDEMIESRIVAESMMSSDGSSLLSHPGRMVDVFCQLWNERNGEVPPNIDLPLNPTRPEGESLAHMALYFPIVGQQKMSSQLSANARGTSILLDICNRKVQNDLSVESLSYLDELENLYRRSSRENVLECLTSRFDESEDFGLDALLLGDSVSPL